MGMPAARQVFRILLVDDYRRWRDLASVLLRRQPGFEVIGEASDGLEALEKALELQPDLIVLDIGLPTVNGIDAARRIRAVAPESSILFLTENRSTDIVEEALRIGALGYVLKCDAASELVAAAKSVLDGKQFVSNRFGAFSTC
jgi:DNA-binding NarL/FixJ family response regulator